MLHEKLQILDAYQAQNILFIPSPDNLINSQLTTKR